MFTFLPDPKMALFFLSCISILVNECYLGLPTVSELQDVCWSLSQFLVPSMVLAWCLSMHASRWRRRLGGWQYRSTCCDWRSRCTVAHLLHMHSTCLKQFKKYKFSIFLFIYVCLLCIWWKVGDHNYFIRFQNCNNIISLCLIKSKPF